MFYLLHAYSHHIVFRFTAQIAQSALKIESSVVKVSLKIATASSPQQRAESALKKGQAFFKFSWPFVEVIGLGG